MQSVPVHLFPVSIGIVIVVELRILCPNKSYQTMSSALNTGPSVHTR